MKVLVSDKISSEAIDLLKMDFEVHVEEVSPEKLVDIIELYDGLVVRSRTKVTKEIINAGTSLKVIGRAGIGVDNIDVKEASSRKIPVVYAPLGSTISVAEITFGQIINLARHLHKANLTMKNGLWEKKSLMGIELSGKTLGLIGMGRIGLEVAKRCQSFGMNVSAYDPYINKEIAKVNSIELLSDISLLYEKADFISIHSILTDETKGMVNKDSFDKMKSTAYILNLSRGGIINEADLAHALETKKIAGAALDVFDGEPLKIDSPLLKEGLNILFSPHIGASTKEAQIKAGTITAKGVIDVLKGNKPEFCVNSNIFN